MPKNGSENSSEPNRFFRLKATGIRRQDEDEFSSLCFEIGADGVAEDLAFVQRDLTYDPDVLETPFFDLNIYFTKKPDEDALLRLQSAYPGAGLEMITEENRDWLEEWKKGFVPFLFAEPFWIVPSWLKPPPEAPKNPAHILYVEPGMAFGTGTHETTRLAAQMLIGLITTNRGLTTNPKSSLLDVGTGTGVLALVAQRLGVSHVVGIDNDPEARRTARENLELNKTATIAIPEANIEDINEKFDIVVANIIDGILTLLCHKLNERLKPGGHMVLSGVLVEREKEFYENFIKETGLKLLKKTVDGEWSAALLEKI
jgi:ribosomal protein L11 methyltransferase